MSDKVDALDYHIEKLFRLIDADNDGSITVQELSERLHITVSEALAIVQETEAQDEDGQSDQQLTLDEFKKLIKKMDRSYADEKILPQRVIQRYKVIFESLDVNKTGYIRMSDLFEDMEISEEQGHGVFQQDNEEVDFGQFLDMMRASERRAYQNMRDVLERSQTFKHAVRPILERVSSAYEPRNVQPFLDVWGSCQPVDGCAEIEVVRAMLFAAQASGELDIGSDELLESVFLLDQEAEEEGVVSKNAFLESFGLVEHMEHGVTPSKEHRSGRMAKALSRMHANQKTMIAMVPELPSETLSDDELELYKTLFEELDANGDGLVNASDLQAGVERLIERQLLGEDERKFFFELLDGISSSQSELDFEGFVVLLQEASERTSESANPAWTAEAALKLIQSKRSRHAQVTVNVQDPDGVFRRRRRRVRTRLCGVDMGDELCVIS